MSLKSYGLFFGLFLSLGFGQEARAQRVVNLPPVGIQTDFGAVLPQCEYCPAIPCGFAGGTGWYCRRYHCETAANSDLFRGSIHEQMSSLGIGGNAATDDKRGNDLQNGMNDALALYRNAGLDILSGGTHFYNLRLTNMSATPQAVQVTTRWIGPSIAWRNMDEPGLFASPRWNLGDSSWKETNTANKIGKLIRQPTAMSTVSAANISASVTIPANDARTLTVRIACNPGGGSCAVATSWADALQSLNVNPDPPGFTPFGYQTVCFRMHTQVHFTVRVTQDVGAVVGTIDTGHYRWGGVATEVTGQTHNMSFGPF